jgi:hypothetical protein
VTTADVGTLVLLPLAELLDLLADRAELQGLPVL